MNKHFIFTLFIAIFISSQIICDEDNLLVWISLDGFRGDYLTQEATPNLYNFFREKGVVSQKHYALFATKTAPNHFSQVTGLTEEEHGIINNNMYVPSLGDFNMNTNIDLVWWDPYDNHTPIWTLNQLNGGKTVSIFWPGSAVPFKGVLPNVYYPTLDRSCTTFCKINRALEYIKELNPSLVMLYIDDIDTLSHSYGPDSRERKEITSYIDQELGRFFRELNKMRKVGNTNIMISSDHGMSEIPESNHIDVSEELKAFTFKVVYTGTMLQLDCDLLTAKAIQAILKDIPNINGVYLREEIPSEYQYGGSIRVPTLTAIPEQNYVILHNNSYTLLGDHGYPNEISPEMIAFFGIGGDSININAVLNVTKQIDLFTIACSLMNLTEQCGEVGGTFPEDLIVEKREPISIAVIIAVPIAVTAAIIIVVLSLYYGLRKKHNKNNI